MSARAILFLMLALCALAGTDAARADGPDTIRIASGWARMAGGDAPPPFPDPAWQRIQLPDDWNDSHPGMGGQAWYRFDLDLASAPAGLWAVYLQHVSMNAAAFVNGRPVGSGGRLGEPMANNWNRPLYFEFPAELLHPGRNTLDIRVAGYANDGAGLRPFRIGPTEQLRGDYRTRFGLQITSAIVTFTLLVGLAVLMLLLWLYRRHETVYLAFALSCMFSAIIALYFFLPYPPVSHPVWTWICHSAVGAYVYSVMLLLHRLVRIRRRMLERIGLAATVAGPLAIALAGPEHMVFHFALFDIVYVLMSIYVLVMLARHGRGPGGTEARAMLAALTSSALFGYHDLLVLLLSRQQNQPLLFFWGSALFGLAITLLLLHRFVRSLHEYEVLNAELNSRVEEKSRKLEASYRQLAQLEKEQAVFGERERIMRDLHDGLGGYLVSALAYTDQPHESLQPLRDTIRAALNDLRLMIDSLDDSAADIAGLLGAARERLESSMCLCGAALHWHIDNEPALPRADASASLHLMRMVQEIFTNIARHSQADEVRLRAGRDFIEIRDNGCGFDPAAAVGGRGLANLRKRADVLGINLEIESSGAGTRILLAW
ncbi:MAG TPA: ATP-binding protein [Parasulfuritortus sp.]